MEKQTNQSSPGFSGNAEKDVSRKTVVTLLVVTMLVVALGLWTVLDRMGQTTGGQTTKGSGEVQINVLPNPAAAPTTSTGTGQTGP